MSDLCKWCGLTHPRVTSRSASWQTRDWIACRDALGNEICALRAKLKEMTKDRDRIRDMNIKKTYQHGESLVEAARYREALSEIANLGRPCCGDCEFVAREALSEGDKINQPEAGK